jgi:Pyruvate/2-oxoacid:ferredoxin oxidoreductase gamma subunit
MLRLFYKVNTKSYRREDKKIKQQIFFASQPDFLCIFAPKNIRKHDTENKYAGDLPATEVKRLQVQIPRRQDCVFSIAHRNLLRKKYGTAILASDYQQTVIAHFQIENLRPYRKLAITIVTVPQKDRMKILNIVQLYGAKQNGKRQRVFQK